MKVSYKHLESPYWKAHNEVMISSKYHRRYKNNGDFGNWIILYMPNARLDSFSGTIKILKISRTYNLKFTKEELLVFRL